MSLFGVRDRLKAGMRRVFGGEPAAPPPPPPVAPAWSRPDPPASTGGDAPEPTPTPTPAPAPEAPAETGDVPAPAAPAAAAAAAGGQSVASSIVWADVQEVLDDMVRPALQGDGGDIALVKIEEDNIYVRLVGACSTCPSSVATMKMGVEALLKEEFPSMKELIQVN